MEIHILNVGCGNMALVTHPDSSKFVIDCNITEDNKDNKSNKFIFCLSLD